MSKVNLFLVGFPKCGTTTLSEILHRSSYIYLPRIKEPNYFNQPENKYLSNRGWYEALYTSCDSKYLLDCSTAYIRDEKAIIRILKYNADSKFIVCYRRDLVDMYKSVANQLYKNLRIKQNLGNVESIVAFESHEEVLNICRVKKQVDGLMSRVHERNIRFICMEDLQCADKINKILMEFLDIDYVQYPEIVRNMSVGEIKNFALLRMIKIGAIIKRKLKISYSFSLMTKLKHLLYKDRINNHESRLDEELRAILLEDQKFINQLAYG